MRRNREDLKVRKITFEQDFIEKEMAFLNMSPEKRMAWNQDIQKKIWGKALLKYSYRKMRVVKQNCDSNDLQ